MGSAFSKLRGQWTRSRASTAAPRARSAPPAMVVSENEVPMVPSSVTGKLITVTGTDEAVGVLQRMPSSISLISEVKDDTTTGYQIIPLFRSKDLGRAATEPDAESVCVQISPTAGSINSDFRPNQIIRLDRTSDADLHVDFVGHVPTRHERTFDQVKLGAYQAAINERGPDMKKRFVLEVACGIGLIGMLCAQHEPRLVHAVDKSDLVHYGVSHCFENDMDTVMTFHQADMDYEKPGVPKVDFIISDFMDHFFCGGVIETVINARDDFLKPGGVVMPDKCAIELIPLGPDGIFKQRVRCWDDVCGFKMSAMKGIALQEVVVETLDMSDAIGPPVCVKALDLHTCTTDDLDIEQEFTFEIQRTTQLCGVAGFFTLVFTGINNPVTLSTAPWEPPTFWKQIVFFLPRPIDVEAGSTVEGKIVTTIPPDNSCKVFIELTVAGFTQHYRIRK